MERLLEKKSTIRDIAKEADVSVATVSHVLNKTRFVSPELIKRVKDAMANLDYQPNLVARSLRKRETGTIGLIIPDSSNMVFAELSKYFERYFSKMDYTIIMSNSRYDADTELSNLLTLKSKMVDGILLVPTKTDDKHMDVIKNLGIPVVLLGRKAEGKNIDSVRSDNFQGGYASASHLVSLGHQEIGYIDRCFDQSHNIDRKAGFVEALKEVGIPFKEENLVRCGFTFQDGADAATRLIKSNPKITAIFVFNDINAIGAIRGLHDLGYSVPKDVSVVAYDDTQISSVVIPSLTSFHVPSEKMAIEASKLLTKRIKSPNYKKATEIVIPGELKVRESTASP